MTKQETEKGHACLVVNCGQLLTLAGPARARIGEELRELSMLRHAAMLVKDGCVVRTGSYVELKAEATGNVEVIDAAGRVVMPGFIDAHTHPVFGGNRLGDFEQRIAGRTYQEIAACGGGIASTLAATRDASEAQLLAAAERHARWFLRGGTTTIEAKSGYGLTEESELKSLRVLRSLGETSPLRVVPTLLAAHIVPAEFRDDRRGYLDLVEKRLIPQVVASGLARYCDVFCDAHAFSIPEARSILRAAQGAGLRLRMHVEQFEVDGGAALAAELGAATADHLECTDVDGIRALQKAGVQPVLLPASVFCLSRSQYPQARAMIEAGLAPVLATDFNPGSSPSPSMPFILSLASLYLRMLPSQSIIASTVNAAASLGIADEVGSLEPGKRADFQILEYDDYRELAYFVAAPARPRVFVSGREVA